MICNVNNFMSPFTIIAHLFIIPVETILCNTLQEWQVKGPFLFHFARFLQDIARNLARLGFFILQTFLQDSSKILQESCKIEEKRAFSCNSCKVLQHGFYWDDTINYHDICFITVWMMLTLMTHVTMKYWTRMQHSGITG